MSTRASPRGLAPLDGEPLLMGSSRLMGLIRGLIAVHNAVESRMQTEEALADLQHDLARGGMPPIERELQQACTGKGSGLLILLDNEWPACEIDGVRLADLDPSMIAGPSAAADATSGPYRGGPARGLTGCFNVCPGRHVVSTRPGGREAPIALSFLVYPGEWLVRRLDREARAFVPVDADEEARIRAQVSQKALVLADYFAAVARVRARANMARPISYVHHASNELWKLIIRIDNGNPTGPLAAIAQELAAGLVGVPMSGIDEITKMIGRAAWERAAAGKRQEAWLVVNLGLAVLTEEPTLLALLGELDAQQGKVADAIRSLDLALARERVIDPFWLERARALRAKLG
ncbi:MAG: hypothetical protein QM820_27305 [Minicystis sp.]